MGTTCLGLVSAHQDQLPTQLWGLWGLPYHTTAHSQIRPPHPCSAYALVTPALTCWALTPLPSWHFGPGLEEPLEGHGLGPLSDTSLLEWAG